MPRKHELIRALDLSSWTYDHDVRIGYRKYWFGMDMAFQGTSNIKDLFDDADIVQVPCEFCATDGMIHRGFQRQYMSMRDEILETIEEEKPLSLTLSGHSLGGVIATYATVDIHYLFPHIPVTCITFGAPKSGDEGFMDEFHHISPRSARVITMNDPFVHYPFGDYHHPIQRCITLTGDTKLGKKHANITNLFQAFKDHSIKHYQTGINRLPIVKQRPTFICRIGI